MPAIRAPKLEDFGGPKKYRSAFFIFSDTKRDAIVNELKAKAEASGEKFNVAQVATTLGEMWKAISAEEKKPLEEQSAAEKAAWQPKHDAWIQTEEYAKFKQLQKDAVADKKGRKAKTAAKKSGMPKKPASLFMYINGSAEVQGKVKAECEKMAAAGTKVEMKHRAGLAKKFHDEIVADETLKAEWNTKFEAAKAQYEIDQKEWLASEAGQAFTKSKDDAAKLLKKQCREKLFAAGYPANVTGGAYGMFAAEKREEVTKALTDAGESVDLASVGKKLSAMYAECSAEDKQKYEDMLKAKTEEVAKAQAQWKKENKANPAWKEWKKYEPKKEKKLKRKGSAGGEGEPDAKRAKTDAGESLEEAMEEAEAGESGEVEAEDESPEDAAEEAPAAAEEAAPAAPAAAEEAPSDAGEAAAGAA